MKGQRGWKLRMIGFGVVGAVVLLAGPRCRAQEVNPDHFTATGIEGVNGKELPPRGARRVKALPSDAHMQAVSHSPAVTSGRARKLSRREVSLTAAKLTVAKGPAEGRKRVPEKQ